MIRSVRLPTGQNPTRAAVGPFTYGVVRGLHVLSTSSPSGNVTLSIYPSKASALAGSSGRDLGTFLFPTLSPNFYINIDELVKPGEWLGWSLDSNVVGNVDLWVWFRKLVETK